MNKTMEYNKITMYYRSKRCELEEQLEAKIPYVSYKARLITNELMDADAVKVLEAFVKYCKDGKQPEVKDKYLVGKLQKVIAIHTAVREFVYNLQEIIDNG